MSEAKRCSKCGEDKPLTEFRKWRTVCKLCILAQKRVRYALKRATNPEELVVKSRRSRLRWKYGLTVEDYDAILLSQSGLCAICRKEPGSRPLAVDHDHVTKAVRGLLCHSCNVGLGSFDDDLDRMRMAIIHLTSV